MAAESAPRDRMPNAIGVVQTAQRIGPAVGPLIGGVFTDSISWRWVWWSNVPVAILALLLMNLIRPKEGKD